MLDSFRHARKLWAASVFVSLVLSAAGALEIWLFQTWWSEGALFGYIAAGSGALLFLFSVFMFIRAHRLVTENTPVPAYVGQKTTEPKYFENEVRQNQRAVYAKIMLGWLFVLIFAAWTSWICAIVILNKWQREAPAVTSIPGRCLPDRFRGCLRVTRSLPQQIPDYPKAPKKLSPQLREEWELAHRLKVLELNATLDDTYKFMAKHLVRHYNARVKLNAATPHTLHAWFVRGTLYTAYDAIVDLSCNRAGRTEVQLQVTPRFCPWGCKAQYKKNLGDAPNAVHEEYKFGYDFARELWVGVSDDARLNLPAGKCVKATR